MSESAHFLRRGARHAARASRPVEPELAERMLEGLFPACPSFLTALRSPLTS